MIDFFTNFGSAHMWLLIFGSISSLLVCRLNKLLDDWESLAVSTCLGFWYLCAEGSNEAIVWSYELLYCLTHFLPVCGTTSWCNYWLFRLESMTCVGGYLTTSNRFIEGLINCSRVCWASPVTVWSLVCLIWMSYRGPETKYSRGPHREFILLPLAFGEGLVVHWLSSVFNSIIKSAASFLCLFLPCADFTRFLIITYG